LTAQIKIPGGDRALTEGAKAVERLLTIYEFDQVSHRLVSKIESDLG
jgi:hypothetical protein